MDSFMDSIIESVLKNVYRKHVLGDESIGWEEVSDQLHTVLTELIGDKAFQAWIAQFPGRSE